mmetsp:Transcript_11218/g.34349  ORF Transcript_11218/g.34349 Transcript_11218/m.34349 type:complete len:242 (-) Transcript_11218:945-1670(-)
MITVSNSIPICVKSGVPADERVQNTTVASSKTAFRASSRAFILSFSSEPFMSSPTLWSTRHWSAMFCRRGCTFGPTRTYFGETSSLRSSVSPGRPNSVTRMAISSVAALDGAQTSTRLTATASLLGFSSSTPPSLSGCKCELEIHGLAARHASCLELKPEFDDDSPFSRRNDFGNFSCGTSPFVDGASATDGSRLSFFSCLSTRELRSTESKPTIVFVFPVPGGPWMSVIEARRAARRAAH